MGDILVISFSDPYIGHYKIYTWNWQTGNRLHVISNWGSLYGLALLDHSYLVILVGFGSLRVQNPALRLYDIRYNAFQHSLVQTDPPAATMPFLQLNFPRLRKSISISSAPSSDNVLIWQDIIPGRSIQIGSTAVSYSHIPILGIQLTLLRHHANGDGGATYFQCYYIFTCVDRLLRIARKRKSGESKVLDWSKWGVAGTRWFSGDYSESPARRESFPHTGITGYRYVRFSDGSDHEEHENKDNIRDVCVLDFKPSHWEADSNRTQVMTRENQSLIRHGGWPSPESAHVYGVAKSPEGPPSIVVGSNTPTILERKDGFAEPVESRLPYRITNRVQPVPRTWRACCPGMIVRSGGT
ncbi:hypothetical protein RSOLAG1IB_05073 [Rhizoctonia solani AG-1 IB]|jgi:hypothetical protein|uniref:Uncharacterized protein n=1 Tax=Thanatephorus cucumeris (strain AG1-IB / isolate 7/3/14) TaxID=1108050 RepID=A0A0B7FXP5_THACB|nr:hypothetical protein RSOLAG1IB_05073 [Rhizoctonia solani AG-1 IB]